MTNRLTKLSVVLAAGLVLIGSTLRAEEPDFAKRIKETVNPHFEGDQFGDGTILRTLEDRYNANFQVASFDEMFGSDNVGGILLRTFPEKPVKVLRLKSATFKLEKAEVDTVLFRLATESDQIEYRVPATIVPAAALMAADQRLVLLTLACSNGRPAGAHSHVDLAAIHPAIANHQLGYMAAQLDLSLGNVMGMAHGRNYLLCEKAWHLTPKSLSRARIYSPFAAESTIRKRRRRGSRTPFAAGWGAIRNATFACSITSSPCAGWCEPLSVATSPAFPKTISSSSSSNFSRSTRSTS